MDIIENIAKVVGYTVVLSKENTNILYLEGDIVTYKVTIDYNNITIAPVKYKLKDVPEVYWIKDFSTTLPNVEDELKNYISSTTNDVIWAFERASEVVWNVNLHSPKIREIVKRMINI